MKITTVLFDLDGTLLPMDQDVFIKAYLGGLVKAAAPYGYEPRTLAGAIMRGTDAMVANDGSVTNEQAFWLELQKIYGEKIMNDIHIFDHFYQTNFQNVKDFCGYTPDAAKALAAIKNSGMRVALATNPLFPAVATESRIKWAGLSPSDFELCTTYETSCHCKPNIEYYKDVISALGVTAEECLMVGNDVADDMVAEKLGMQVFLLTDCLINKAGEDISRYPHGDLDYLITYLGI
jgi:FMN phosphatase YigB (HAD superfamily)